MAKIAVITDLHFGARDGNKAIMEHQREFYTKVFFPYMKKHKIDYLWCLGDTFDRRKYVNFQQLAEANKFFFQKINVPSMFIIGNHDVYLKNTNDINSPSLLMKGMKDLTLVEDEPLEITIDNFSAIIVPWINASNRVKVMRAIKKTSAPYCFGHFEFSGFEFHQGQMCLTGQDSNPYDKFDHVFSGHFHKPATRGNITYLGNPYQLNWAEYPDMKRFLIIDTEEVTFDFVNSPIRLYYKVNFRDGKVYDDWLQQEVTDFDYLKGKFVRLQIIGERPNQYEIERVVERINDAEPYELKVIDDVVISLIENDEVELEVDDTYSVIRNYVSRMEGEFDSVRLEGLLLDLYKEAQEQA
jgi:DNA repair exonuclease SbcCD nuclease subunit